MTEKGRKSRKLLDSFLSALQLVIRHFAYKKYYLKINKKIKGKKIHFIFKGKEVEWRFTD
jgi:hypothetical protein